MVGCMNEISRREELSLAGAALHGAPWKAAAVGGMAAAAASYGLGIIFWPPSMVTALGMGVTLFALIAAIGALSKPEVGDRVTRKARQWSLRHPWRFALMPAAVTAVLVYPVHLVADSDGIFGAAWHSLWRGALVYLITGILGVVLKGRSR